MPPAAKTQRWIDLIATLLARHYPVSFETLARDVPAYATPGSSKAAVLRKFERDKDELRALGVPIETVADEHGANTTYRLSTTDFYLPYLVVAAPQSRTTRPSRIDRFGYRSLKELAFTADELAAVADAAARIRALGEPLLTEDVESAIRKLALDLPLDATASPDVTTLARGDRHDAELFDVLTDALTRRKIVEFDYHTISRDSTERRSVEPYGLFFLGAHWYLAANDRTRGELRNFRLSRMSGAAVNPARAQSADYEIPASFRLREHARSRQAWELGDGGTVRATVHFLERTGAAAAASRLGDPVEGHPEWRAFDVRRAEAFVRWLLSFGGAVVPVSPAPIVEAYADQIARTLAIYGEASADSSELQGADA